MRMCFIALAAPLIAALPAMAQDRAASSYISQGSYGQAESQLTSELRIHPDRPELLLNLAAVYARTGRVAEARTLYTRVLSQNEVLMDLSAQRTASSHAVARRGMGRLDAVQFSAR
ncbi:tetratricopeptide repeat protein [Sphingomonas sp. M1-B02]|uniref:tetratricopeptide repeat protein n=1 Tax=Sphingomonas sp. M1-B02 TaxID=3114300 RepID=UPI00223EFAFD|nr:tetratricopeptide repeat protein [Sphingomonas sp. S6-11]UZK66732.1 tetratricopeptide repeat protein [Sphingomonas sp. S6-11]